MRTPPIHHAYIMRCRKLYRRFSATIAASAMPPNAGRFLYAAAAAGFMPRARARRKAGVRGKGKYARSGMGRVCVQCACASVRACACAWRCMGSACKCEGRRVACRHSQQEGCLSGLPCSEKGLRMLSCHACLSSIPPRTCPWEGKGASSRHSKGGQGEKQSVSSQKAETVPNCHVNMPCYATPCLSCLRRRHWWGYGAARRCMGQGVGGAGRGRWGRRGWGGWGWG